MARETISCQFNLFNEGRVYTGNHRKYVLESALDAANSPATKEKIAQHEALGYYGHGRRVLANKLSIGEVEAVKLPDGTTVIMDVVPSNRTTAFEVCQDGTVKHTQEILETEPGKIVSAMNASRVGGFSWACPGRDGGRSGATHITGFAGFDYVKNPGFAHNRGYVLESADADVTEQMILESVAAVVHDDVKAEMYVRGWLSDAQARAMILEDSLFQAEAVQAELRAQLQGRERDFADLDAKAKAALTAKDNAEGSAKALVRFLTESVPFFIPEDAMHKMLEGDFTRAKAIFESASKVDFSLYPLGGSRGSVSQVKPHAEVAKTPEYGDAGLAWEL